MTWSHRKVVLLVFFIVDFSFLKNVITTTITTLVAVWRLEMMLLVTQYDTIHNDRSQKCTFQNGVDFFKCFFQINGESLH